VVLKRESAQECTGLEKREPESEDGPCDGQGTWAAKKKTGTTYSKRKEKKKSTVKGEERGPKTIVESEKMGTWKMEILGKGRKIHKVNQEKS